MKYCFSLVLALLATSACQTKTEEKTATATTATNADTLAVDVKTPAKDEKMCFEKRFKKDLQSLNITTKGDSVFGDYSVMYYEKDGATGTVKGVRKGEELMLTYAYMIEGSNQIEETVWKLSGNKIIKKSGELKDENGILSLKYPEKAVYRDTLVQVKCQ